MTFDFRQPRREFRGDRLGQEDAEVRAAARFAVLTAAGSVVFLILAAVWASNCDGAAGAVDTAACGTPLRVLLALGAPGILFVGGIWAFLRTYRVWRDFGTWWGWQGAGWFLLMLMLVLLLLGAPPIAGPALGG